MFKSGKFVADYVRRADGSRVSEDQIQTHGVELTIDNIFQLDGRAEIANGEYKKPERDALDSSEVTAHATKVLGNKEKAYILSRGITGSYYVVQYNEQIEIPHDAVGFVWPRSRLLRCGMHLTSAVWESGYKGRGEGALYIATDSIIAENARIGQMVMCRADVLEQYDGSHQNERLDDTE